MAGIDRASAGPIQGSQVIEQNQKKSALKRLLGKFSGRKVQKQNNQNKLNDSNQLSKSRRPEKSLTEFKVEVVKPRQQASVSPRTSLDALVNESHQNGLNRGEHNKELDVIALDRSFSMTDFQDTVDETEFSEQAVKSELSLAEESSLKESEPLPDEVAIDLQSNESAQPRSSDLEGESVAEGLSVVEPEETLETLLNEGLLNENLLDENNNEVSRSSSKQGKESVSEPEAEPLSPSEKTMLAENKNTAAKVTKELSTDGEVTDIDDNGLLYHEEFLELLADGDLGECCEYLEQSYSDIKALSFAWNALLNLEISDPALDMTMAKGMFDLTAMNLLARDLDNTLTDKVLETSKDPTEFKAKLDNLLSSPAKLDSAVNRHFHSRSQAGSQASHWFGDGVNLNALCGRLVPLVYQRVDDVRKEYQDFYDAMKGG